MILTSLPQTRARPTGLAALGEVVLNEAHQRLLDTVMTHARGSPVWVRRKKAEARDLLALSQIAGRLHVQMLDVSEVLRAVLWMRVPVACRPQEDGSLPIAPFVVLGLTYPEEALRTARPGYSFFQVLVPETPWHANIAPDFVRPLCLGTSLPAGVRVKELVLMAYGALSMQTVQIDERDSAGVMNAAAAQWWQSNLGRIPLSREPFLSVANGGERVALAP